MILKSEVSILRKILQRYFELIFGTIGIFVGLLPIINVQIDHFLTIEHHLDVVAATVRAVAVDEVLVGGLTAEGGVLNAVVQIQGLHAIDPQEWVREVHTHVQGDLL